MDLSDDYLHNEPILRRLYQSHYSELFADKWTHYRNVFSLLDMYRAINGLSLRKDEGDTSIFHSTQYDNDCANFAECF